MALETWSPSSSIFQPQKPPGEGWAQTGTKKVQVYAPPKAGWDARWKTVPIYSRQTPQAAAPQEQQQAAPAAAAPSTPPPPTSSPPPSFPEVAAPPAPAYTPPPAPDFSKILQEMQIQSQRQIESLVKGFQEQMAASEAARADEARRMQEAQKAYAVNQSRAAAAGNLKIQGADTQSGEGGTEQFKIRRAKDLVSAFTPFINTLNI